MIQNKTRLHDIMSVLDLRNIRGLCAGDQDNGMWILEGRDVEGF